MTMFQCSRKGEHYRGQFLPMNCIYGRDEVGPYIWKGEYASERYFDGVKKEGWSGPMATLLLLRLDVGEDFAQGKFAARGWHEVWEHSETTLRLVFAINGWKYKEQPLGNVQHKLRMRAVGRYGNPNRCSEIPANHGHARVFK